ncbi:MAG: SUMF1/EgtB/PvdO family nonheme iron enzyme [Phycisphaeraceae bacterium]|nr:SUMF1/EgtB/PvdO family nonheme iron enzyme [Phycisphaeraceae bacterium]
MDILVSRRALLSRAAVLACAIGAQAFHATAQVGIESVLIDNAGNLASTDGFGAVPTNFAIGKFEVTNEQYARFLNAVATDSDPNNLWNILMGGDPRGGISRIGVVPPWTYASRPNMAEKPVNFVTWADAARFCNWLHHGQPTGPQGPGTTEDGAYFMVGNTIVPRAAGARWYMPNEDEWYKAAYHDPVNPGADGLGTPDYWLYPTMTDLAPMLALASAVGDVANPGQNIVNHNFGADWAGQDGHVTTVGSATSKSFYHAFDMAGNIDEILEPVGPTGGILLRGGGWDSLNARLRSTSRLGSPGTAFGSAIGFRVAANFTKSTTFSIAPGTTGLAPPPTNDVFLNPDAADLFFSQVQIKRDTINKGNMINVETAFGIGLQPGDDVDAVQGRIHPFSRGAYQFRPNMVFSVRPGATGAPGSPVAAQAPTNAADLFITMTPTVAGGHMLALPEIALGLSPANVFEDLDALSLEPDAPFPPGSRIWFSLRRGSTTLLNNGWSGADILTAIVGAPGTITVSIPHTALGLLHSDDLDALLMVEGVDADNNGDFFGPFDVSPWIYFSVDPLSSGSAGSPLAMQAAGNGAAADIFESVAGGNHNLYFDNVLDLGLAPGDDIDALEAPEVECGNPPFADFRDPGPPFGGGPPPPWPPKRPSVKVPLCYTIAICDTPFPRDWKGTIRQDYIDCTVIPGVMQRAEVTICGRGGSKSAAMAALLRAMRCPTNPAQPMFDPPIIVELPPGLRALPPADPRVRAWKKANLDPCIACDPQADRIVAQITVWANVDCIPNAKLCPLEISLTNYTISIVKPVPGPVVFCDRRLPGFALDLSTWQPEEEGIYDIVFGTGNPDFPENFIPAVPIGPSSNPFFVMESLAQQIRGAGGVAGVLPPTPDDPRIWLLVERTPVDPPESEHEIFGPIVVEAGSIARGAASWYKTDLITTPIDCNGNQIPDIIDIATGFSSDENGDDIPDECQPCSCPADYDCNGLRDVPDIFAFLADWFAGVPAAFNFGGTPGVPAIFAFLTAWFAGC